MNKRRQWQTTVFKRGKKVKPEVAECRRKDEDKIKPWNKTSHLNKCETKTLSSFHPCTSRLANHLFLNSSRSTLAMTLLITIHFFCCFFFFSERVSHLQPELVLQTVHQTSCNYPTLSNCK